MKQYYRILFICMAIFIAFPSCSDMKQRMQEKVKEKLIVLGKKIAQRKQEAAADSTKQSVTDEADPIDTPLKQSPPLPGSVMSDCPALPSAADLLAGNTETFAARLGELRNLNKNNYYKKSRAVRRDHELIEVFGHTQAEVDRMNQDQQNATIAKAYKKQKEKEARQATAQKEINQKIVKAQEGGLMGMALMLGEMKESNKKLAKEAEEKFFETNKELIEGIDRYKARRKEVDELVVSRKYEVEEEIGSLPAGEERCEAWRSYITEMQQYYHALLPEARRADSLGMKLDIPTPKLYTPRDYDYMNEYYLNWKYLDFTESITELYY
ncbi:hypothetical protein [Parabacteroides sp.]